MALPTIEQYTRRAVAMSLAEDRPVQCAPDAYGFRVADVLTCLQSMVRDCCATVHCENGVSYYRAGNGVALNLMHPTVYGN